MKKTELHYIHSVEEYLDSFLKILIDYSPKVVSAIIVLVVGLFTIKIINKTAQRIMLKREVEVTLSEFLSNSLLWAMRIILFVTIISRLGIETSSFVAILGAAGLAIGLSLQGSLSNFAGGILIILFKPFRVGDSIEAQNVSGTVVDIEIFTTKLLTANNQTVFIPNGILSNGTITNHSLEGIRRADLVFSLSYTTNIKSAREIVMQVMQNHPKVIKKPAPTVSVKSLTDSAIILAIRPWTKNADFGDVCSDILENCKDAFDKADISIQPFVKEDPKE
jgi:small conductance mechanosensitive channel